MNQEIERKFAIKYIPRDLQIEKIINIKQNTIYRDNLTLVRLRKTNVKDLKNKTEEKNKYIYTVKTKGDIDEKIGKIGRIYEIENEITEEQYNKIIPNKKYNTINKTRLVVKLGDVLKAEIDIYYDYLEGLLTLEVEFPNSEEANKFKIPDWFGEELGYDKISNGKLARMNRQEFENTVGTEFLEENKKNIEDLKKIYNI